jgi:hypothetical protein
MRERERAHDWSSCDLGRHFLVAMLDLNRSPKLGPRVERKCRFEANSVEQMISMTRPMTATRLELVQ